MQTPPASNATSDTTVPELTTADLAGFWIRLGAFVIDSAIIGATSWIISFSIGQIMGAADPLEFPPVLRASFMGLIGVFSIFYFPWFWRHGGQTPGKRALGIKLIRTDARPLAWRASWVRFLGYVVCTAGIGVPFIMVAFDSRKQGPHDKMARTYVIMVPKKKVRAVQPDAVIEHV
ncbi:MAG: RDD family protein [Dehalococcoidia bacterium]|nr:RDD family protein [Dehalococcoidia bacterium]